MSKPINNEELTQDELNYRIQQAVQAKFELLNTNSIQVACTIRDKKLIEGKPKLDTDGNVIGKWDDSYSVELVFQGGSFGVLVDRMTYDLLEIGTKHYLASGYISSKANEYGRMVPNIKITNFERIY